ncbi:MAG TPA: hypothetical protein VGE41_10725 [Verrucomicrobiae bacterium]|jgi:hypothetical protein
MNKDWREFTALLNSHGVDYLIVRGYCLAYHGVPRYTGDIDFFIRISEQNAEKIEQVIQEFGFSSTGLGKQDFLQPGQVIQLGFPPHRIDLLSAIEAVSFDEAWEHRIPAELDGLPVFMLSKDLLIRNKEKLDRPQDRVDVQRLKQK